MKRKALLYALAASALALPGRLLAADAATYSFTAAPQFGSGSTIETTGEKIVINLRGLPKGATVFRAVLRCSRSVAAGWNHESDAAVIVPADKHEAALALCPPRFSSFDATEAIARSVQAGAEKAEFLVKSLSGWKRESTRLDVWLAGAMADGDFTQPTGLTARHRNGQTLLTWKEVRPPTSAESLTFAEWREILKKLAADPCHITYRIYRHSEPISAATIAKAQLIDEVGALTCWNPDFHGISPPGEAKLLRYVVEDGKEPVPPGTGIYAHSPRLPAAGGQAPAGVKVYYAVTAAVNGQEDLSAFTKENSLAEPVSETVGPGEPVLQRIEKPEKFFYTSGITLHYYVRWEAPPRCNLPSRPYDYLVTVPEKLAKPAPLNLVLHCWGSNLYGAGGAYTWHSWKDKTRGIGVASNQIPYDWWTCYHENLHTWRPWTEGLTRDFTGKRLLAFVDWVAGKWDVDQARICVSGESMGGSGSTFLPIRYGGRFAYAYSAVGIHNPIAIKGGGFYESYARVCGRAEAEIKHESGMLTFDYLNDPLLVRKNPAADLPFIGFGNGKNDHGIGWPHAVDLAKALQEARQPHAVVWRLRGHGSGTWYPGDIDFRSDQSLPAFTHCSLDDNIGTAKKLPEPVEYKLPWGEVAKDIYDGDHEGQINQHVRWRTDDAVDAPDRWEMTIFLAEGKGGAPKDQCTVNVTPRRCRAFKPKPGQKFTWAATPLSEGGQAQSGQAGADQYGLVTMEKVLVPKGGARVRLAPAR